MDINIKLDDELLNMSPYNKLSQIDEFTACVGTNGNYGQDTICDGFKDAVQILINSLGSGEGTADSLVYLILFQCYFEYIYQCLQILNYNN